MKSIIGETHGMLAIMKRMESRSSSRLHAVPARSWYSTTTHHNTSSHRNTRDNSHTFNSSHELLKSNRTSSYLYRILLRTIQNYTELKKEASITHIKNVTNLFFPSKEEPKYNETYMLLQPPINPQNYGRAQMIPSSQNLYQFNMDLSNAELDLAKSYKVTSQRILAFLSRWAHTHTQKEDTLEEGDVTINILSGCQFQQLHNHVTSTDQDLDSDPDLGMETADLRQSTKKNKGDHVSLVVSHKELTQTIKYGFLRLLQRQRDEDGDVQPIIKKDIIDMQRFAIDCMNFMETQISMWDGTSVSVNEERGIRVIVTSRCIGKSGSHGKTKTTFKNRFAYRINIENINMHSKKDSGKESNNVVQILGRTWNIFEDGTEDNHGTGEVVQEPTTGVVGHFPVIQPGESFQYMSGCDLNNNTGRMDGFFHMAIVDPSTKSGRVGDDIAAFNFEEDMKFTMPIGPFNLDYHCH